MKTNGGQFVKVADDGTYFQVDGKPYYFVGANFWYAMNLASIGPGGDRNRLLRELDRFKNMGITNVRIMGGSEGPDTEPWRVIPSLQPAKGVYNPDLLEGLDFLLAEMGKRGLYSVIFLNNFWDWSGGLAQYISWETGETIPYPKESGNWDRFQRYSARFYRQEKVKEAFDKHIRTIVNRVNSITGRAYKDDPTIMAWELANEPRGMRQGSFHAAIFGNSALVDWVHHAACLIKELDQNHMVCVGSEGDTPFKFYNDTQFTRLHQLPEIDYATIHIWVQEWKWYDPNRNDETFDRAVGKAQRYLNDHMEIVRSKLHKPLVLEEFGIARDLGSSTIDSTTIVRDNYYEIMLEQVHSLAANGQAIGGANFWIWGGEGRPHSNARSDEQLGRHDDATDGPLHEFQGMYSVYDTDEGTITILKKWAEAMNQIEQHPRSQPHE